MPTCRTCGRWKWTNYQILQHLRDAHNIAWEHLQLAPGEYYIPCTPPPTTVPMKRKKRKDHEWDWDGPDGEDDYDVCPIDLSKVPTALLEAELANRRMGFRIPIGA